MQSIKTDATAFKKLEEDRIEKQKEIEKQQQLAKQKEMERLAANIAQPKEEVKDEFILGESKSSEEIDELIKAETKLEKEKLNGLLEALDRTCQKSAAELWREINRKNFKVGPEASENEKITMDAYCAIDDLRQVLLQHPKDLMSGAGATDTIDYLQEKIVSFKNQFDEKKPILEKARSLSIVDKFINAVRNLFSCFVPVREDKAQAARRGFVKETDRVLNKCSMFKNKNKPKERMETNEEKKPAPKNHK